MSERFEVKSNRDAGMLPGERASTYVHVRDVDAGETLTLRVERTRDGWIVEQRGSFRFRVRSAVGV